MSAGRGRLLLLAPAALLAGAVIGLPVLRVVMLSVMHVELGAGIVERWAGAEQYIRLWHDSRFWTALRNTAVFTGGSLVFETLLGVAFALLLHRRFRGRGFVRAIVVLPWALPTAVMALAWAWVFNDAFGVANDLLRRLGVLDQPVAWLGSPTTAMAVLVLADVWKTTPFVALIVLAGLQGIPEGVLEAARVDGLGAWQRFRYVTLPLLAPALAVAMVFRTVQAYGAFDLVYVMTGGGPGGSTETVSLYSYQQYFRYLDFGYGSAVATAAVSLALVPVLFLLRAARRLEGR